MDFLKKFHGKIPLVRTNGGIFNSTFEFHNSEPVEKLKLCNTFVEIEFPQICWKLPALETSTKETMKKTGVPSLKEMGGGVFLADADKGKPIPNNAGKKYFKWTMQARLTLLRECQFREVW